MRPSLPAGLLRAWRRSRFQAGPVLARPGQRSPSGDAWLAARGAREAGFVTAWNPWSRRHPRGWNERRQAALRLACRGRHAAEGWSGAGRWWEHNLLVAADGRWLARLARRFRQTAILRLRRGQPARLVRTGGARAQRPSRASQCAFTRR